MAQHTYASGSVAVANGSKAVTLTGGLSIAANMRPGDVISIGDATLNAIEELVSPTTFTLATPHDGTGGSGLAYVVIHMPIGWGDRVDLAEQTAELIRLIGQGIITSVNYQTRAQLFADLNHAAGQLARVWGDSDAALVGVYKKTGGINVGSWSRIGNLPDNNAVEAISEQVSIVANNIEKVNTAADNLAPIGVVAGIASAVQGVDTIKAQVPVVSGISAEVVQVAQNSAAVVTVADNASSVVSAATNMPAINDAPVQALIARQAAEASGAVLFFDTKALATDALAGLASNQIVEVFNDEDRGGARTRYRKEGVVLVYKTEAGMGIEDRFVPGLTGAAPRTIRSKLEAQTVDLNDFRTLGSSDWTTALSKALVAANEIVASLPGAATDDFASTFSTIRGPQIRVPRGVVTLDAASFQIPTMISLLGEDRSTSAIVVPDGEYLFDNTANALGFIAEDLSVQGGKGLVMLRNDSAYSRGIYRVDRCNLQGFTEAAIANLSSDFGRWLIRENFFWSAGSNASDLKGIGIALRGVQDNSEIARNFFHKVRVGMKLRAPRVAWVRNNSFFRQGGTAGLGTDIWLVPDEGSGTSYGSGLQLIENRHGRENSVTADNLVLVADADAATGDNFANQLPSLVASTKRLDGVTAERNYAEGFESEPRPYVRSYLSKLSGWNLANQITDGVQGEIEYMGGAAPDGDTTYQRNRLSTQYWSLANANPTPADVPSGWAVDDPHGYYAAHEGALIQRPGGNGGTNVNWLYAPGVSPRANAGSSPPTATAATDAQGGAQAVVVEFPANDPNASGISRESFNFTVASADVGRAGFVEVDLKRAALLPLTKVVVAIVNASGTQMRRTVKVPVNLRTVRLPWTPRISGSHSISVFPADWVSGSKTSVHIENVTGYQAPEPVSKAHVKPGAGTCAWNGSHYIAGTFHVWATSSGYYIKNGAPTSASDGVRLFRDGELESRRVSVPASTSATGSVGDWAIDANYAYFCHVANTWRRVAIATW